MSGMAKLSGELRPLFHFKTVHRLAQNAPLVHLFNLH